MITQLTGVLRIEPEAAGEQLAAVRDQQQNENSTCARKPSFPQTSAM
jgi:hypothetical protein